MKLMMHGLQLILLLLEYVVNLLLDWDADDEGDDDVGEDQVKQ